MIARAIPTVRRRPWLRLAQVLGALLLAVLVMAAALWAVLRIALAPQTGEWATTLGRGPLQLKASVPQLVWLATTPWIGARLDGLRVRTAAGPVTLGWVPAEGTATGPQLTLHCEPCALPVPATAGLPARAVTVPAAQLVLMRDRGTDLRGLVLLGAHDGATPPATLALPWRAARQGAGWRVAFNAPAAPARDWLALLAPGLPELRAAQIDGTLALSGELQLPHGALQVLPTLDGLAVRGLGTGQLAGARASCGTPARLGPKSWLVRAVLAAEDQRFYEHPGYDVEELAASLERNRQAGAVRRGASTLTQQLAKLMVTGDARTPERKLRELLYAVEMEQTLGKGHILQLYLDHAPWGEDHQGRLICGAEAAARHYFGVSAARLNPRQAITLAAMLRNPQREAARWAEDGSVDRARLVWVAEQIRGVPVRQRRALAAQLDQEREALRPIVSAPLVASAP